MENLLKLSVIKFCENFLKFHEQQNCSFGLINLCVTLPPHPSTFVGLRDHSWHLLKTEIRSRPKPQGKLDHIFADTQNKNKKTKQKKTTKNTKIE